MKLCDEGMEQAKAGFQDGWQQGFESGVETCQRLAEAVAYANELESAIADDARKTKRIIIWHKWPKRPEWMKQLDPPSNHKSRDGARDSHG
jgi:hypothetical protein